MAAARRRRGPHLPVGGQHARGLPQSPHPTGEIAASLPAQPQFPPMRIESQRRSAAIHRAIDASLAASQSPNGQREVRLDPAASCISVQVERRR